MDAERFWEYIEVARPAADAGDQEGAASALQATLTDTSAQTVVEFHVQFRRVCGTLYRWDVWAAAALIGGGCSDDAFCDFQAGLVVLGRDWVRRVLAEPDSLADHPAVRRAAESGSQDAVFAESVNHSAAEAYQRFGDIEEFYDAAEAFEQALSGQRREPREMGPRLDLDDEAQLADRLPRLAGLFLPAGVVA